MKKEVSTGRRIPRISPQGGKRDLIEWIYMMENWVVGGEDEDYNNVKQCNKREGELDAQGERMLNKKGSIAITHQLALQ